MNKISASRRGHKAVVGRVVRIGAAVGIVASGLLAGPIAHAAPPASLQVNLSESDGTAPFDTAAGPGNDTGPNNGIVRVNDTVTYNVEVAANGANQTNTTFHLTLPQGEQITALPAFCGPGSSITPATLPPPTIPLTAASYLALPTQTLNCDVGARVLGSTATYPVVARVRSEVPNGTVLTTTASATSDQVTVPAVSNPVAVTATATMKYDLSKNGVAGVAAPDTGALTNAGVVPCPNNSAVNCFETLLPVTLSAPNSGKGTEPIAGPITFQDNVSAAQYFPGLTPAQVAAINADPAQYGVTAKCVGLSIPGDVPYYAITGTHTAASSVRNSGTETCAQPGGPGTPITVTINGADTSLYTFPTTAQTGQPLPDSSAYAISAVVELNVPVATVRQFGSSSNNGPLTLAQHNTYSNFAATGIDGQVETGASPAELPADNFRNYTSTQASPGGGGKLFAGIVGHPNNNLNYPGPFSVQGPPAPDGTAQFSGAIPGSQNENLLSVLVLVGSNPTNPLHLSGIACDSWNNTQLQLQAGNYPATPPPPAADATTGQTVASNGAAVWMSGYNNATGPGSANGYATSQAQEPTYTVEYGTGVGGAGAASDCRTGTYYASPDLVPGNDPTLAAQGIYTAVTRVRIYADLPAPLAANVDNTGAAGVREYFSIGMRVISGQPLGTDIGNFGALRIDLTGTESEAALLADPNAANLLSTYDPATNTGSLGDRLVYGPGYTSIIKEVKGPNDTSFSPANSPTRATGGQSVQFQLAPTFNTGGVGVPPQDVSVYDCLPAGLTYTSATVAPASIQPVSTITAFPNTGFTSGTPTAATPTACPTGSTYITFDLGSQTANNPITPVVLTASVDQATPNETVANSVYSYTPNDAATVAERVAGASVLIQQPAGILLGKVANTPQVVVNAPGTGANNPNIWTISLRNNNSPTSLTDPAIIDKLPANGDAAGSNFHGLLNFVAASVTVNSEANQPVVLSYTSNLGAAQDPADPSNGPNGSTTYCNGYGPGAMVVSGSGGPADCPASAAAVAAFRIARAGTFLPGDNFSVQLNEVAQGDQAGDRWVNSVQGRVTGLVLPVGPVTAPEMAVATPTPTVTTAVAAGTAAIGSPPPADTVNISGTSGATATATYTLAGPVPVGADGTCNSASFVGAPAAATGMFPVAGDGTYRAAPVAPLTKVGCYGYRLSLPATATTAAVSTSNPATNEQFVIQATPAVTTAVAVGTALIGQTLPPDRVTVTGTAGQELPGSYSVLGPVAPDATGTCVGVSYTGAPVFDTGTFTATGDGVYTTSSTKSLVAAGCYSYADNIAATPTSTAASSPAGAANEVVLVSGVPGLAITKTASEATANPGDKVTYTVKVTNTGTTPFTAANPATFTDSLANDLTDAAYNNDAVATAGTVSYAAPVLSYTGPLAVGASATVTYSVTVNNPDTGPHSLKNTVVSTTPGNNCPAGSTDPACSISIPVSVVQPPTTTTMPPPTTTTTNSPPGLPPTGIQTDLGRSDAGSWTLWGAGGALVAVLIGILLLRRQSKRTNP